MPQRAQQAFHAVGDGTGKSHGFACCWVSNAQDDGVQTEPRHSAVRDGVPVSVITEDGRTSLCKVNSNLVCPAGVKLGLDKIDLFVDAFEVNKVGLGMLGACRRWTLDAAPQAVTSIIGEMV